MSLEASFKRLSELKKNWDSYGAEPADPRAIQVAKDFAGQLTDDITNGRTGIERISMMPSTGGGVSLTWLNKNDTSELEVMISKDGKEFDYQFVVVNHAPNPQLVEKLVRLGDELKEFHG